MGAADVTDEDYVIEFGLDPELANTPRINDAILDRVEQANIDYFIQDGMEESEAKSKAAENRRNTNMDIQKRLAAKGLL